MNKYYLYLAIICFGIFSCKKNNTEVNKTNEIAILFDTKIKFDIDTIIDSVNYISLDMDSDNSLFRDAHKIVIQNEKIFVLDIITKKLLHFNIKGNFVNTVGSRGSGPGEYVTPSDFDIDADGNIYIYNGPKKEILVYNDTYLFQKSIKLPFDIDNFGILSGNRFLFALAKYNQGKYKDYQVVITDSLLNTQNQYVKYGDNFDPNYILETFMQKSSNGEIIYYKPIDDKAYFFSEIDLQKTIFFEFGKDKVPGHLRKDITTFKKEYANSYSFVITTPILTKKYLLGSIVRNNNLSVFVYDINNKSIYETQKRNMLPVSYMNDYTFVSLINAVMYPDYLTDEKLNMEQKKHLEDGGTILGIYKLK